MNRWSAMGELQKHSPMLRELFYRFEEHTRQAKRHDKDDVKSVQLIVPLGISLFFPMWTIVASIGRRYGVNLNIVDVKGLELAEKETMGRQWISMSNYKPAYTVKCIEENEIESAVGNLANSKRELNTYLEKIYRGSSRIKRI